MWIVRRPGPVAALLLFALMSPSVRAQPNELAARGKQATQAMNEGRYEHAAAIYRQLLLALPGDAGLHMNLGMALAMAGREGEAIAPLRRAVELQPTLLQAHLFLGSSLLSLGRGADAVPSLERVVKGRPQDAISRGLLARALLAAGRPDPAIAELKVVATETPRTPAVWYELGQAYNAVVQDTLATFAHATEEKPFRDLLLADALREDRRFGLAFRRYRDLLPLLPGTRAVHDSLAVVYEEAGHPSWAAQQRKLGAAVTLDCAQRPAECSFAAGRHDEVLSQTADKADPWSRYWRTRAASALGAAAFAKLEALPDSRERRLMRAERAAADNRHVDAVKELEAALAVTPDDPGLLAELAVAHYRARDYEQALAVTKTLLARVPGDPDAMSLQGHALLELQRLGEALPILERAVELNPQDVGARTALGRAYVQKGDAAAAIPLLEPALADDQDGTLHFQLARAYQAVGQAEKAKPLLAKYQELQRAQGERNANETEPTITPPS